ncbi:MAG: serine acetyltransferase [Verrucomicrobiaceae bacterium]|nr:MAG: serine acetyltransferase [Verrucomicrobiaceae bacterium]
MESSLGVNDLTHYLRTLLGTFFPDKLPVTEQFPTWVAMALDRLEHCFGKAAHPRYNRGGQAVFNHLYSDHCLVYFWFLANTVWREGGGPELSSKLYYLNKILHGFDCAPDTGLPDIFLVFHGSGTVLGKAKYSDYFVSLQGCTVGSHHGKYPTIGRGVALTAHSGLIGDCVVGDRVSVGCGAMVFGRNIDHDTTVFRDSGGKLNFRPAGVPYAQQFFTDQL